MTFTFGYIMKAWKSGDHSPEFIIGLMEYIVLKTRAWHGLRLKDTVLLPWVEDVAVALDIGMMTDRKTFASARSAWVLMLGRDWDIDIDSSGHGVKVIWKDRKPY